MNKPVWMALALTLASGPSLVMAGSQQEFCCIADEWSASGTWGEGNIATAPTLPSRATAQGEFCCIADEWSASGTWGAEAPVPIENTVPTEATAGREESTLAMAPGWNPELIGEHWKF
ncbi:MAG: hypothetical protein H7831_07740 [Magnetococcus sp. WYHC-3]